MKKHLFITDLDGTLFTDEKTIAPQDLDTLCRLRQNNTLVAIATGRSLYSFEKAIRQMGLEPADLPVDYLIFSTGAGIMDVAENSILQFRSISFNDIQKICACFDARQWDYMVHRAIPDTPYFLYKSHGRDNPDFYKRIQLYQEFSTPLNHDQALFARATQVLAVIPGGLTAGGVAGVRRDLDGYSVIHATSPLDHCSSWIEVFHKQVSKSLAAAWLAKRLDISRDQVIAVGNDYNDQDLLAWAGKGYLTANGAQDLRPCFVNVSSNNHCGVSEAARLSNLLV